jgi:hypothetical protein
MIYGPPKIVPLLVEFHVNLVQVPPPLGTGTQILDAVLTDFNGKYRAKSVPPKPDGFVAHVDATFVQDTFYVSKRERKPDAEHHRQTDDFGLVLK